MLSLMYQEEEKHPASEPLEEEEEFPTVLLAMVEAIDLPSPC